MYAETDILLFKECYASEKIHGSSSHVSFKLLPDQTITVGFFSGEQYATFVTLFNVEELKQKFQALAIESMIVFGETYGGKVQGMSKTYGKDLKFVAFDVKMGEYCWLNTPDAESIVKSLGLEFVDYVRIPTTIEALDAEKNRDSVQAVRNGLGEGHMREGIVLRPIIELKKNNGERIIAKYKRDEFRETTTRRKVSPDRLQVLTDANKIADEWCTEERLGHVLSAFPDADITKTGAVIKAMNDDIIRESTGEIVFSDEAYKAIGKRTARLFKQRLQKSLGDQ